MLSSHPLPVDALAGPALRRIFTDTPPAPKTATRRAVEALESTPKLIGDRYQIESYLESGGTADVFVAQDLATSRRCALKLLREETANHPVLRAHFLSGARAAMRIHHPHVVTVFEVAEPRHGTPYAAMELLEGKPMDAVVKRDRALPPLLATEIVTQAARGLAAAHAEGVVHCDVKPENLFATRTPEGALLIKILDFDLASVSGEVDPGEDHVMRGTAKYMAPEQILGDPVDGRADVYGLGMTFFRLLTGHLPFDLELSVTLLRHHLLSAVPPASWLAESVDERLDTVITRATRKHPDNRYASAEEFLLELEALASEAELSPRELAVVPDLYEPRSQRGWTNARALAGAA
jgi:serine/threonine protein kinase